MSEPGRVDRSPDGTILNTRELTAEQVNREKVLCPGCHTRTFPAWPEGWEAHAALECAAVASGSEAERQANFKRLFHHFSP